MENGATGSSLRVPQSNGSRFFPLLDVPLRVDLGLGPGLSPEAIGSAILRRKHHRHQAIKVLARGPRRPVRGIEEKDSSESKKEA